MPLHNPGAGDEVAPRSHPTISLSFESAVGSAAVGQRNGGEPEELENVNYQ